MEILGQGMSLHSRKRRFPGPAGLLPDLDDERIMNLNVLNYPASQLVSQIISADSRQYESIRRRKGREKELPQSTQVQRNQQLLTGNPWKELIRYLNESPEASKLLNEYSSPSSSKNIDWVLSYARKLRTCVKIPFLTVILQETPLVPRSRLAEQRTQCVKVIDPSGTIDVALDPNFVKLYSTLLVPGTALAVKNAGLFHHSKRTRRVIVAIRKESVIYVASVVNHNDNKSTEKVPGTSDSESDKVFNNNVICTRNGVMITKVYEKNFSFDDLLQDYKKLTDPKLYAEQLEELKRESQFWNDNNSSSTSLSIGPTARKSNSSTSMNQQQSSTSFLNKENTSDSYPDICFEDDEDGDELFKNINLDSLLYESSLSNNNDNTTSNQSQVSNEIKLLSIANSQSASNDNNDKNKNNSSSDLNTIVKKEESFEPFGDDDSFDKDMFSFDMPEVKEVEKQTNIDKNLDSMLDNEKEEEEEPALNKVENPVNEDKKEEEVEPSELENPFDECEEEQEVVKQKDEEENPFSDDEEMDFEYENEEKLKNSNLNNQTSQNNDDPEDDFFDNFDAELQMM